MATAGPRLALLTGLRFRGETEVIQVKDLLLNTEDTNLIYHQQLGTILLLIAQ